MPSTSMFGLEDEKAIEILAPPPGRPSFTNGAFAKRSASATSTSATCRTRYSMATAMLATVSILFWLLMASDCSFLGGDWIATDIAVRSLPVHARAAASTVLEVFQVYPPVLTLSPAGVLEITDGSSNASVDVIDSQKPSCQETLVVHSFGYSYGKPYVGQHSPPACSFNRISWNLTVESRGRQFDRLGTVSLGDIEVFRTSTAEPTANGIEWTYIKDMTNFLSLFKEDQTIIFDLGNLVNDVYTGAFNVTLTSAFFTAADSITPADLILPVSSRQSSVGMASAFSVPADTASNSLTFPQNVKKAVFTIAATGQQSEEFWWSNVLQSETATFPTDGPLYGYSPFRELQLYIDGSLAGVAWPFPIIFTGGIVPGFWRPVVGIDAFDLKEDEIDITPWLPILCDGNAHNFTIRVSGLNDHGNGTATLSETTNSYWMVTGKAFIWLDTAGHVTTGDGPYKTNPAPTFTVSSSIEQSANGTNQTLLYEVKAQRRLSYHSTLDLSNGSQTATWQQTLSYFNSGNFSDQGNIEITDQHTTGRDVSSSGYARQISYPLSVYSVSATDEDSISYVANIQRGKDVWTIGEPVFPTGLETFSDATSVRAKYPHFQGAHLATTQNGSATYLANQTSSTSYSFGDTEQDLSFDGVTVGGSAGDDGYPDISGRRELFHRYVQAVNGSVTQDDETLLGESIGHTHGRSAGGQGFSLSGVPGRGARWHGGKT